MLLAGSIGSWFASTALDRRSVRLVGRPLWLRIAAGVVSGVIAALPAACSTATSGSGTKDYVSGTGAAITVFDPASRQSAPRLRGTDLEGKAVVIGQAGGLTVINVWAAWCPACWNEADALVQAAHQLPHVAFYGIDIHDVRSAAQAYVRRSDVPYPSLYDPSGRSLLAFHDIVTITSPPTTVVIDAQGRVAAVVSGELTATTLVGLVHDLARKA